MNKNNYFKNLSKTLSGNFLAMLGFLIFSYTFVGAISRLVRGVVQHSSTIFNQISFAFIGETFCYLPFTCLLSLIPTSVLFSFLYKPKFKIRTQLIILLAIFLFLIKLNFVGFDYSTGAGIFFAFALGAFPLTIIYALIFFILVRRDFTKTPNFKNKELINNRFYKLFVSIFYIYAIIIPTTVGIYVISEFLKF